MLTYRDEPVEVWDAHVHMGTREVAAIEHAIDIRSFQTEELLAHMDEAGVDVAAAFAIGAGNRTDYAEANRFVASAAAEHPDRIVGFLRLNPRFGVEHNRLLIEEGVRLGLRGIKLHPLVERFPADDPDLVYPLMELAEHHRLVVLFHCGQGAYASPDRIARVARDWPRVSIIAGHSGLSEGMERVVEHARHYRNLYMETSAVGWMLTLCDAVLWAGPDRVLFGSDAPFNPMRMELDKIVVHANSKLRLSVNDLRLIVGGNLKRLLRLP